MEDKERASIIVLLHQVFSLNYFAHLESFQEGLLKHSIFDQTGEGEMGFETFKDKSFVSGGLFLINDCEIFINLVVIALHFDRAEFSGFSSSLLLQEFLFTSF